MLKTAAQHELTVTTCPYSGYSILTIPKIRLPRRQIAFTTSSVILFSTKLGSSRIQSMYCSIKYWFVSFIVRPSYENINLSQPDSFKSTGVTKCRLPQIAILDVVSADVVDECRPSDT